MTESSTPSNGPYEAGKSVRVSEALTNQDLLGQTLPIKGSYVGFDGECWAKVDDPDRADYTWSVRGEVVDSPDSPTAEADKPETDWSNLIHLTLLSVEDAAVRYDWCEEYDHLMKSQLGVEVEPRAVRWLVDITLISSIDIGDLLDAQAVFGPEVQGDIFTSEPTKVETPITIEVSGSTDEPDSDEIQSALNDYYYSDYTITNYSQVSP